MADTVAMSNATLNVTRDFPNRSDVISYWAARGWVLVDGGSPVIPYDPFPQYVTDAEMAAYVAANSGGGTGAIADGAVTAAKLNDDVRTRYLPKWKANTPYASGEPVISPSGQLVTANAAFTSGSSYNASNWTVVAGGGGGSGVPADGSITPAKLSFDPATQAELDAVAATIPAPVTDARIQDVAGGTLVAGTGISVAYDPASKKATIAAGGNSIGVTTPQVHLNFVSQSPAPVATYAQLGVTTGAGLYAPFVVNVEGKIDTPINGAKYYMLCSTNHSAGAGGLYLLTAPTALGPWTPYTGGPNGTALIYQDTVQGFSTETPWVVWEPVSRLFYVYYQQAGTGGNQGTVLAVTADFVTFDRIGTVFLGSSPLFPGDQHNGYGQVLRMGRYQWIGWHLNGGSDWSHGSMSHSVDGVRWMDDPAPTGPHSDMAGQMDRKVSTKINLVQVNGRLWGVARDGGFSSGVATGASQLVAAPMTGDLDRWARPPQICWEQGYAWETDMDSNFSILVDNDGSLYCYYVCGTKDNGGVGLAKGALIPMREAA